MINAISKTDLNAISQLYVDTFKAEPWNEPWTLEWAQNRLDNLLHSPVFIGLKIHNADGDVVGVIMGRGNTFLGDHEFEICEFYICPKHQSLGLGSQLYDALLDQLKLEDYKYIILVTSKAKPAFDFYIKKGFSVNDYTLMNTSV